MGDVRSIAKHIEGLGENGDKHLIHVNPTELSQIMDLLGRKPNVNKKTGLMAFDDGGGGDSGDSSSDGNDSESAGSAAGEGAGNAGGGAGDPGSDDADTGTSSGSNGGSSASTSAAAVSSAISGISMQDQMDDLNAVNTISITAQDLMDNPTVPDRSFMGEIANAIASPMGITIGTDAFGNFSATMDANIAGTIGSFASPAVGYMAATIADELGLSHAQASYNSATGFSVGLASPDVTNQTGLANAIDSLTSGKSSTSSTSGSQTASTSGNTSTASSGAGSAPGGASGAGSGAGTSGGSENQSAKNVETNVSNEIGMTSPKDQVAKTSSSDVIARFISGAAIKAAVQPINPFTTSGHVQPVSLLRTIASSISA